MVSETLHRACVIFDVDGTLADNSHRAVHLKGSPKDWDSYNATMADDLPIQHIIDSAKGMKTHGAIIICTGRQECHRAITSAWLDKYGVPYTAIYMRETGDFRDDVIVKRELLEKIRADYYRPTLVIDDRKKVVVMWRDAGLPCIQVAPGDF